MKFLSFFSEHCKEAADLKDDVWIWRLFQTSRHVKTQRDEQAQKHSWHSFILPSARQNNNLKNIRILYRLPASKSEALSVAMFAPTVLLRGTTSVSCLHGSALLFARFNPHSLLHPPTVTAPYPQLSHTVILAHRCCVIPRYELHDLLVVHVNN